MLIPLDDPIWQRLYGPYNVGKVAPKNAALATFLAARGAMRDGLSR